MSRSYSAMLWSVAGAGRSRGWVAMRAKSWMMQKERRMLSGGVDRKSGDASSTNGTSPVKKEALQDDPFKPRHAPPGQHIGSSVSDHDSQWYGTGSSVSDADNWRAAGHQEGGSRFQNPVVQQEQRMFHGLEKMQSTSDKLKWPQRHMIAPMGEQRRKPFKRGLPGHSIDEVWGRKGAEEQIPRPARIILVRHGESQGNSDEGVYGRVSDWRISLTDRGRGQATKAAEFVKNVVGDSEVFFYYSPYSRAVETCQIMLESFDPAKVRGIREDPRMAEQQFGNLQDTDLMKKIKNERHLYGRFFYRFPSGEAGLDVYSRVTSFIATIKRDHVEEGCSVVIVTHGLALRLFLMAWFRWTVEQFESTTNPPNCGVAVLERVDGSYRMTDETCRMMSCENDGPSSPCLARGLWEVQGQPPRQDLVGTVDKEVDVASLRDVRK